MYLEKKKKNKKKKENVTDSTGLCFYIKQIDIPNGGYSNGAL